MLGAKTHRTIYLVLLTLLGCTMVCSTWAANLMWVLLVANWVLEGRWQEKWQMLKHSRALHVYLALWFLLAIGLLWSSNIGAGLQVMQVSLPLLAVPLVVLTTPAPEGRARRKTAYRRARNIKRPARLRKLSPEAPHETLDGQTAAPEGARNERF